MKPAQNILIVLLIAMISAACDSPTNANPETGSSLQPGGYGKSDTVSTGVNQYPIDLIQGQAYSIIGMIDSAGADDSVYYLLFNQPIDPLTFDPFTDTTGALVTNGTISKALTRVSSFVAETTGRHYLYVLRDPNISTTVSYTLITADNHLTAGGAAKTLLNDTGRVYASFVLSPGTYRVDISNNTDSAETTAIYQDSPISGTQIKSVLVPPQATGAITFTIPVAGTYYVNSALDNLTLQLVTSTAAANLGVVIYNPIHDGSNLTVDYTIYNYGLTAASNVTLDLVANASSKPAVGTSGDGVQITGLTVAQGGSSTGTITVPATQTPGSLYTAYAIVDTGNTVTESNESNNVSTAINWTPPVAAPATYDFEGSSLPVEILYEGTSSWVTDTVFGNASSRSFKSSGLLDGQGSCFSITATNSIGVNFDSFTSTETWDYLRFYVDGSLYGSYSNISSAWAARTSGVLTQGLHTYRWCYVKDGSISSGSDSVWVDNIVIN